MTDQERINLAQQLLTNPLFEELLREIERDAIEALLVAKTEQQRVEMQWRVHATRAFATACDDVLRSNQPRKGAPA
jgi:hypothetical protein